MSESGGYTLDLYCDFTAVVRGQVTDSVGHEYNDFYQYAGSKRSDCVAEARSDGWMFHRDGKHSCPRCRRGKKRRHPPT